MTIPLITADEIAIICPTKDRPDKVVRLLGCIVASQLKPAQVLIADGGHNLKPITKPFEDRLNITCLYCPEAGQVLQRNFAHLHLDASIKLVIHLDDEITFAEDALGNMLDFWNGEHNKAGKPLGGASFNLVDIPCRKNSIFRKMMLISTEPKGGVNAAGYGPPFCPADDTMAVSWLLGGATVWRRDILNKHKHPMSFKTRWAGGEDLMFSYPLRSSHRLMVVKHAVMYYNDTDDETTFRQGVFFGISRTLINYYFVSQQKELSILAFLWMNFGLLFGQLALGSRYNRFGFFIGQLEGLTRVLFSLISLKPRKDAAMRLAMSLANRKR
ncbi:MAG: glycosyltransferase family 2 protein [Candidatus Puniceispirillales bacterium WSBS_2018_MAG_OTU23]